MSLASLFPSLNNQNYKETSDPTDEYNCIAWAVGRNDVWVDPTNPQYYWPDSVPRDDSIDNLVLVFQIEGYEVCTDKSLESGIEKIAIYGDGLGYTHAARQLPNGKWTSKLGGLEDIEHDTLDALCGSEYGQVERIMKRPAKDDRKREDK